MIGALPYAAEFSFTPANSTPSALIVYVAPATATVFVPFTYTLRLTVSPGLPLTVVITHSTTSSAGAAVVVVTGVSLVEVVVEDSTGAAVVETVVVVTSSVPVVTDAVVVIVTGLITILPSTSLTLSEMSMPLVSDTVTFAHVTGISSVASAGTSNVITMITALSAAELPLPSACANAYSLVAALFVIGALPYAAQLPLTLLKPASELIVNVAPATLRSESPSTYTGTSTDCPGVPSTVSITHVASLVGESRGGLSPNTIAPFSRLILSVMIFPFVSDTVTFDHSIGILPPIITPSSAGSGM